MGYDHIHDNRRGWGGAGEGTSGDIAPGKRTRAEAVQFKRRGAPRDDVEFAAPSGGGSALPMPVQAKMEDAFGTDFSDVRVHQGEQAGQLGAVAFAQGSDLHFAPGAYDPGSESGQVLIGHELTHVVQQRAGRVATPQGKNAPINADPGLESEADEAGAAAARGERVSVIGSAAGLQRKVEGAPIQRKGDSLEVVYDTGARRAQAVLKGIKDKDLGAVIIGLSGPPCKDDPEFLLEIPRDDKGTTKIVRLTQLLTDAFSGMKLEVALSVAKFGELSPKWRVLLALGEITHSIAFKAGEKEAVAAVESAPGELARFGMTWDAFWEAVEEPLRKTLDKARWKRVLAFHDVRSAKKAYDDSKEELAGKIDQVDHALKEDPSVEHEKALHHAEEGRAKALGDANQKRKETIAAQLEHLASIVHARKGSLNDFDLEAIGELREWAERYPVARKEVKPDGRGVFEARVRKDIKKKWDQEYLIAIVGGNDSLAAELANKHGFDQHEAKGDEVHTAMSIVSREETKHKNTSSVEHAKLKATLATLSPAAREQYLAVATGRTAKQLEDPALREGALADLRRKLMEKSGVPFDQVEEILADFRTKGASRPYAKLTALVRSSTMTSSRWPSFSASVLEYVSELEGDELFALRQDRVMISAIATCEPAETRRRILNVIGLKGDDSSKWHLDGSDQHGAEKARDDAELSSMHWAVLLNRLLPVYTKSGWYNFERNVNTTRNETYLLLHRAQMAASRYAVKKGEGTDRLFMSAVLAQSDRADYIHENYPNVWKAIDDGTPITSEMLLHSVFNRRLVHFDPDAIMESVEQTRGKPLLDEWSNIADFERQVKDSADPESVKHQFVLDIKADRKSQIEGKLGKDGVPIIAKVRARLKAASEHDAEFKQALESAGVVNDQYMRERMHFRTLLEGANRRRKGWQVGGIGDSDMGNHARLVGHLRDTDKDIQTSDPVLSGHGKKDKRIAKRDEAYAEHGEELEKDGEDLARSGAAFDELRAKIRTYVELAIMLVIVAAVSAATAGAGLAGLAPIFIKAGALIVATVVKELVGNAIDGSKFDTRKVVIQSAAALAGAVLGGVAGFEVAGALKDHAISLFATEAAKVSANVAVKVTSKQLLTYATEKKVGDVTLSGSLLAFGTTLVSSLGAGEVSAAFDDAHEQELDRYGDHMKEQTGDAPDSHITPDKFGEYEQDATGHGLASTNDHLVTSQSEAQQAHDAYAQYLTSHKETDLESAQHHLEKAHEEMGEARDALHAVKDWKKDQDLKALDDHLALSEGELAAVAPGHGLEAAGAGLDWAIEQVGDKALDVGIERAGQGAEQRAERRDDAEHEKREKIEEHREEQAHGHHGHHGAEKRHVPAERHIAALERAIKKQEKLARNVRKTIADKHKPQPKGGKHGK